MQRARPNYAGVTGEQGKDVNARTCLGSNCMVQMEVAMDWIVGSETLGVVRVAQ